MPLDPILEAHELHCLLLSEELNTKQQLNQLDIQRSMWLWVTLMTITEKGALKSGKYCRATARIAVSRGGHISRNEGALSRIFYFEDEIALDRFSPANRYIGGANAAPLSQIEVVKGFCTLCCIHHITGMAES